MTPEQEQAMLMEMIGRHEQPAGPVSGVDMTDPESVLAPMLSREYGIPVEEILAIPRVEGQTLRQRLESMRPSANIGGLELGTDGRRITGRVEF